MTPFALLKRTRMKIFSFFEVTAAEKAYLKSFRPKGYSVRLFEGKAEEADGSILKQTDILSVFIYSQVKEPVLKKCSRLKFIATRSTGFDHIDIATCKKRKIAVANVPFYSENTAAEHTF